MLLPNLIFGETHYDSANRRILSKLVPQLKSLGYLRFLAESPPGTTLDGELQTYKGYYEQLRSAMLPLVFFSGMSDRMSLAKNQEAEGEILLDLLNRLLPKNTENSLISKYLRLTALNPLLLYQALDDCKITFQPIDDAIVSALPLQPRENLSTTLGALTDPLLEKQILETLDARNETMSKAYLSASEPVFGLVGALHIGGIQHNLINSLGWSGANEKYNFFYIYSDPENNPENNAALGKYWFTENGLTRLPFNVTIINAANKSDDDVVNEIIDLVVSKSRQSKPESIAQLSGLTLFGGNSLSAKLIVENSDNEHENKPRQNAFQ